MCIDVHSIWVWCNSGPSKIQGQLFFGARQGRAWQETFSGTTQGLQISGLGPYPIMASLLQKLIGGGGA